MSQSPHPAAIRYEPAIDGLRAIAVLAVIVFHLDPRWLPGGFTGVDVFFVISGYLITRILLKEFDEGTFSIWRFYHRRIARIVPALAFVGFATLLAAQFVYDAKHTGAAGVSFILAICSLANVKLWLQGNYFEASGLSQPFLHCWSLALEEQFYLVFPLLLGAAWRRSRRAVAATLVSTLLVSLVACVVVTPRYPAMAFSLLPFRAWELLAGSCLGAAVWCGSIGGRPATARMVRWLGTAGLAVALVAVREAGGFPGWIALVPVVSTVALIAATVIDEDAGSWWWSRSAPMVRVGKLSYALYLTHWPVFSLIDYGLCDSNVWLRLALKVVLTVVATLLLYAVVEVPARKRLITARTMRREALLLLLGVALVIPSGLVVRRKSYVSASMKEVKQGGVVLNERARRGTVALIGDSHANQYAVGLVEVCQRLDMRLVVLSVDGTQPIPSPSRSDPPLWRATMEALEAMQPDVVVLSCNWTVWLQHDRVIVDRVVAELHRVAPQVVLITATPFLPPEASREAICRGSRPPFFEDPDGARDRVEVDRWLRSASADGTAVIDVGRRFVSPDREFVLRNAAGRHLYLDPRHLNEYGAAMVIPDIEAALASAVAAGQAPAGDGAAPR